MSHRLLELADVEELVSIIEQIANGKPAMVTMEQAEARFRKGCRLAYKVTRNVLDMEKPLAGQMLGTASEKLHTEHGTNAICSALILQAFAYYLEVEQGADREGFKTKFILSMDKAVQALSHGMRETHDAWTEQSTQERSAEPPKTP